MKLPENNEGIVYDTSLEAERAIYAFFSKHPDVFSDMPGKDSDLSKISQYEMLAWVFMYGNFIDFQNLSNSFDWDIKDEKLRNFIDLIVDHVILYKDALHEYPLSKEERFIYNHIQSRFPRASGQ